MTDVPIGSLLAEVPSDAEELTVITSVARAVQYKKKEGGESIATVKSPVAGNNEPVPDCSVIVVSPAV